MRIRSEFVIVAALATLGGCDDHSHTSQTGKDGKTDSAQNAPARLGVGWRFVVDTRQSAWGFADEPIPIPGHLLAAQSNTPELLRAEMPVDPLAGISTALLANVLPARGSVRIEELVNRAVAAVQPPGGGTSAAPTVLLATAPWNDDTLLLWVNVPNAAERTISIEFDPASVTAFRPLGNPAAMPGPDATGRWNGAAMLYELAPRSGDVPRDSAHYAIVHVVTRGSAMTRIDRPITAADAVGVIDNAPDVVRLATAAAGFGELLRGDPAVGDLSCNDVIALAQSVRQPDLDGWRAQLVALMYRAEPLIDAPPSDDTAK